MPRDNMNQSSSVDNNATTSSVNNNDNNSYSAVKNSQRAENQDSNKKAAKVAAKGAATYFAGPAGGKVVDALAKTKVGDKILNKGGEALSKIPGMSKASKKLDDSGALDATDKAISVASGSPNGASSAEAMISNKQIAGENPSGDTTSQSPDKSSSQNMTNPLGKGFGGKKGGLGKPSSLSNDDGQSQDSGSEQEGDISSEFSGFGFIKKKKVILLCIISCLPLIFIGLVIASIGGADNDDEQEGAQESGREGYVDKEYAKGTRYERYIKGYNESSTSTSGTNCTYSIKGITNSTDFTSATNINVSNLKVRLMYGYGTTDTAMCDGPYGKAMDEPLIDFEDYVMGVVYAEVSGGQNKAEAQAQAIAARSFAIYTAVRNKKLINENGQWIIEIRNCVGDQVYCNVDKGCSRKKNDPHSRQNGSVYTGVNNTTTYKGPLAKNAKQRAWISEVNGVLAYNKKGYLLAMNYADGKQKKWKALGNQGLDYKQTLKGTYGGIYEFTSNCSGSSNAATGDYTSWKQYGAPWSSIHLGKSKNTIKSAGCLATSISMLVAKSGVSTNVSGELNPGTFVQALSKNGGFSSSGNLQWNAVGKVAPKFVWSGNENILGKSKKEKLNKIKSLQDSGYYVVAEVKGNTGQHWVAIDSVNGNTINMMDPGSTSTNMWQEYSWKNTSRVVWFKAG